MDVHWMRTAGGGVQVPTTSCTATEQVLERAAECEGGWSLRASTRLKLCEWTQKHLLRMLSTMGRCLVPGKATNGMPSVAVNNVVRFDMVKLGLMTADRGYNKTNRSK